MVYDESLFVDVVTNTDPNLHLCQTVGTLVLLC